MVKLSPTGGRIRAVLSTRRAAVNVARPTVTRALLTPSAPPPIQPIETAVMAIMPNTVSSWVSLSNDLAAASVPMTRINGIGPRRESVLASMNLHSIPQLATAVPETIAAEIDGVSDEMAHLFIAEARAIAASTDDLPAPLVSCVMPTFNRRHFVSQAIHYFLRQDYPHKELIIIDDGDEKAADLIPEDERIRYISLTNRQTIGAKYNMGCEVANGPLIAIWDDDVWQDSWRLSYQVAALIQERADICGLDNYLHYGSLC